VWDVDSARAVGNDREEGAEGASEPDDKKGGYAKAFESSVTATRATVNGGRRHVSEQREGAQVNRIFIRIIVLTPESGRRNREGPHDD
jgi:hypothetical protein